MNHCFVEGSTYCGTCDHGYKSRVSLPEDVLYPDELDLKFKILQDPKASVKYDGVSWHWSWFCGC